VGVKNVTVGEEFFQGHFPGTPLMPAVLMIEALTQLAAVLVLDRADAPLTARACLRGVDGAKFRRSVVPGDRLRLEVALGRVRSRLARVQATAYVEEQVVAEAELLLAIEVGPASVDPSAHVHPAARIGEGTVIGPHAVIGADVRIGKHCRIGASRNEMKWRRPVSHETAGDAQLARAPGGAGSQPGSRRDPRSVQAPTGPKR
jgi:3-hydroxyacyl-[acyl-carrier-protein] dehydratase